MAIHAHLNESVRARFGCSYPITYVLAIPAGLSGLTAYIRHRTSDPLTLLPTRTRADTFNGVDAARFDYAAGRAHVSAAFAAEPNDLYIHIFDGAGQRVEATFVEVANYYDDRVCPVILTWDDWNGGPWSDSFVAAGIAHADRGLWYSPGVNAGPHWQHPFPAISQAKWDEMQAIVDLGFCEPVNHGYSHLNPSQGGYDADQEIRLGAQMVRDHITMPAQSRRGNQPAALGWVEPYGQSNAALRALLSETGHVNQRRFTSYAMGGWAPFDPAIGVYSRHLPTIDLDTDLATANTKFDQAYATRSLYLAAGHPWRRRGDGFTGDYHWDEPEHPIYDHLDYLAGRTDVWYAGWGHSALYRRAAEEVAVTAFVLPIEYQAEYRGGDGPWLPAAPWGPRFTQLDTAGLAGPIRIRGRARNAATLEEAVGEAITVQLAQESAGSARLSLVLGTGAAGAKAGAGAAHTSAGVRTSAAGRVVRSGAGEARLSLRVGAEAAGAKQGAGAAVTAVRIRSVVTGEPVRSGAGSARTTLRIRGVAQGRKSAAGRAGITLIVRSQATGRVTPDTEAPPLRTVCISAPIQSRINVGSMIAVPNIRVGDVGTRFDFAFCDESGAPLDLSDATGLRARFMRPDGTTLDVELVRSGTPGVASYTTPEGFFSMAGHAWRVQGIISTDAGTWHCGPMAFAVLRNLPAPAGVS